MRSISVSNLETTLSVNIRRNAHRNNIDHSTDSPSLDILNRQNPATMNIIISLMIEKIIRPLVLESLIV